MKTTNILCFDYDLRSEDFESKGPIYQRTQI